MIYISMLDARDLSTRTLNAQVEHVVRMSAAHVRRAPHAVIATQTQRTLSGRRRSPEHVPCECHFVVKTYTTHDAHGNDKREYGQIVSA
jgi:hypothetical protein